VFLSRLVPPFADRSAFELIAIDFGYPWQRRTLHASQYKEEPNMSVVINTNSAATIASNNLSASNAMLQRSLNRLSSGSKIVNASDDAGGVAVAGRLSAAAKRAGAVSSNIGNGLSYLQQQDSALKTVGKMLERMSELAQLSTNEGASSDDTALYAKEGDALVGEINSIVNYNFNGNSLFSGVTSVDISEDGTQFTLNSNTALSISATDLTDLDAIKADIQTIADMRADNGADQSVLGFYAELNSAAKVNFEAATSRIVDVDVAEESTQLARWNTLVQAGTAMIAQANGSTQSALTLLR
jgi:flagellin